MKAVILCGGRGSRIAAYRSDAPKPLLEVCGKPVLTHQIEALRREGVRELTLVTGYRAEEIESYYGDGAGYGVSIRYYREAEPLGTAGALFRLRPEEDFLLLNGDLVFDFDAGEMAAYHKRKNALVTLFAHPNTHPADSTLLETDDSGAVTAFYPKNGKPPYYQNLCSAGIQIVSPQLLSLFSFSGAADLDRDVLTPALQTGRIFAYRSSEYVKDMGTPARLAETERDVAAGLPARKKRTVPQRAVFLDRDGTLNVHRGYISSPDGLELLPGAGEAVRAINRSGWLAVLITNQPVVARGECTPETLRDIHRRLEMLLAEHGAYLDGIYVCPHHPDRGFPGENPLFKKACACRKPQPGLILRAAEELCIDLAASYMVGDTETDVQTALNAGCVPVRLTGGENAATAARLRFPDLRAFAQRFFS